MEKISDQLLRISDLAFKTCAEITVTKTDELPEDPTRALEGARKAADRISELLDKEFGPGYNGGLFELEAE